MARKWYPVIDYLTYVECGTCVARATMVYMTQQSSPLMVFANIVTCHHGIYDTTKAPLSVVKNPELCVDHCHGCGNCCPVGAITYLGEDTGWTPPNEEQLVKKSYCSCGCEMSSEKKIVVDYLYLYLGTCNRCIGTGNVRVNSIGPSLAVTGNRCIGTGNVLDEVMMTLTPALSIAGFEVEYNKIEMKTAEIAEKYKFLSSPTIRVNGHDICQSVAENNCGCCSNISGTDVNCRVFEYKGKPYEVPPKEMLAEAILSSVFGQIETGYSCGEYKLPENLKEFYEGKKNKSSCSCN